MNGIEAFPLCWPIGRPRTFCRSRGRFKTQFGKARDKLLHELSLLGAKNVVVSSNIALRNDGIPYANRSQPQDTGIAVYFTYKKKEHCFACDRWDNTADNIHAINLTIGALRGISRWGTGDMMEAAFTGFEQLPAPVPRKTWREILGIHPQEKDLGMIRPRFLEKAKQAHPDNGGSNEHMSEVNRAWEEAQAEIAA